MKQFFILALSTLIMCSGAYAQSASKEVIKDKQRVEKMSDKQLNSKASKLAKKEAKALKKQGFKEPVGKLPLEKQLDRAYHMQYELDENGNDKYLFENGIGMGSDFNASKDNAMYNAKVALAGQIQEKITAITEGTLGTKEGESINETIKASKSFIAQNLSRVLTLVECYKQDKNGKFEVHIQIAYNYKQAMAAAAESIKAELEKKGVELHGELDKLLNLK